METIASVIMTTIVGLLVKFRLRELCQVKDPSSRERGQLYCRHEGQS